MNSCSNFIIWALLAIQFLKQMEKEYNKGNINKQAYNLLKEDIKWLLVNLWMTPSKLFKFVLLPLIIFVLSERFLLKSVDTSTIRNINYVVFSLLVVVSVLLGYKNYTTNERKFIWYLISILIVVGSVFYIYTIYSLSHFGF